MALLATFGSPEPTINFVERPTVKVVIFKGGKVLLINDGLLPGGGVEQGESDEVATSRELAEELAIKVQPPVALGEVEQYRSHIRKHYVIHGYAAEFLMFEGTPSPQDEREAAFTHKWYSINEAIAVTTAAINKLLLLPGDGDSVQGPLFNRQTTLCLLKSYKTFLLSSH